MNWIGFTNPWLLAALAAAGLPVLIHFLTRARPRRIVFPPYRFLVEACAGQQAIHRLRTFLLLTLRCLAVFALVLVFARPFLKPTSAASSAAAKRVALIVDASVSMRAVDGGMPLFARAKAEASDVLRSLDAGAEAAVILMGTTPQPLLPALSRNTAALHDGLVRAQATFENGDPGAAMALAGRMLGNGGTVYIFSDFQQSNWQNATNLPGGFSWRLRPASARPVDNVAITGVRVAPSAPVAGESVELNCTVLNSSAQPRRETVRLKLGNLAQSAAVSVPPFSTAEATFTMDFPRTGVYTGEAALDRDDFAEDNTRYISVRVHKAMRMLVVSDADAGDSRSAAFFVARALVPSAESSPGLQVTRRHSQDTDRGILETADAFVVVAPSALSGEAIDVISRRVNDGAQLIVCLDGVGSSSLVTPAFAPPFQVSRAATAPAGEGLLPASRSMLAEADAAEWGALRIRRHLQTQTLSDRGEEVLLAYADGSAALTLSRKGKGGVVFANVPFTPDASDFIGHPLFPSLLHDLLRALRRGEAGQSVTPGLGWTMEAPGAANGLVVAGADGKALPVQVVASGSITKFSVGPAAQPGIYAARRGEELAAAEAINLDPRESDTRPMAVEKLRAGDGASVAVVRNETELTVSGNNRPLWPALAAAAALFLGLEMLLLAVWRSQPRLEVRP